MEAVGLDSSPIDRFHIRAGILHWHANLPYLVIQHGADNRTFKHAELGISEEERPPLDGASQPAYAVPSVPEPDPARISTDHCGRSEQKPTEATEGLAQGSRPQPVGAVSPVEQDIGHAVVEVLTPDLARVVPVSVVDQRARLETGAMPA